MLAEFNLFPNSMGGGKRTRAQRAVQARVLSHAAGGQSVKRQRKNSPTHRSILRQFPHASPPQIPRQFPPPLLPLHHRLHLDLVRLHHRRPLPRTDSLPGDYLSGSFVHGKVAGEFAYTGDTIAPGWTLPKLYALWYTFITASLLLSTALALIPWGPKPKPIEYISGGD